MNGKQKEDYYSRHNALALIENGDLEKIKSVRWYIDCGDDDFLYEGNSLVHIKTSNRLEWKTKRRLAYERSTTKQLITFIQQLF